MVRGVYRVVLAGTFSTSNTFKAILRSVTLKKSVLLFFIFLQIHIGDTINEEKHIKNSHFQGKFKDFVPGNKIQQVESNPYDLYYSCRDYGACWNSDSH
jgi:hypothetical protein